MAHRTSTTKGFKRTNAVLSTRIREAAESRGFAVTRLLTHWEEIAGADIARMARPVDVSYGRGGFGASLTLLTTGATAPMLEMQKEQIRERVNACYGYNAIARIRITQTAATGFADGQAVFQTLKTADDLDKTPSEPARHQAAKTMADVQDPDLRAALTRLGAHIIDHAT